ncbi:nSTAND3 domain-containing NTPase [Nocardiopsis deserti]|uniref:nSTAND3 domain-containing NTPase n=1 Tax=Nocardiopsis deserti TaxID=2605988 RepID=UPI00123C216F|nr:restriction endonuclease [Nocardiopsis deserti]
MDSFDLGRLTDFDFEVLCKDIIENILGERFEIFSRGADGGVDLRRLSGNGGKIIVQCKHWHNTPRSKLVKGMGGPEKEKIKKLSPDRYILMTSASLTPDSKKKIFDSLNPYLKGEGDIFGVDDIVTYLNRHQELVGRHVRLWLSSASVLRGVIAQEVHIRSHDLIESLDPTALTYVSNPSLSRSMKIIEENHSCIISGSPGIGKTTLAQIIALHYRNKGYELFEISRDVDEVNKVWEENSSQFFYYDDFLGQTTLQEKLGKNEDNRILSVISRVQRAKNKKLVFTTREYILRDAVEKYERLSRHDIDIFKCVVNLGDYSKLIRAEMLYNHVYFSPITADQKRVFAEKSVYGEIINREDFNPRMVAFTLGSSEISPEMQPKQVASFVVENLKNPRNLWSHIVDNQLDSEDVLLLESLFLAGAFDDIDKVKSNHAAYLNEMGYKFRDRNFRRSLKIMEGTMVSLSGRRGVGTIGYTNPSIRDFISDKVKEEDDVFGGLCRSAKDFSAFRNIIQVAHALLEKGDILGTFRRNLLIDNSQRILSEIINDGDPDTIVFSLYYYLSVAEMVDSEDMAEFARPIVESSDFVGNATDGEGLVDLVKKVYSIEWDSINSCASSLAEKVSEWIMDDISDWSLARHADLWLEELGDLASMADVSHVQERLMEMAEEGVDAALQGEYVSELDEMIDLIENDSSRNFSAEDLSMAKSMLYAGPDEEDDRASPRLDFSVSSEDSGRIEAIFDSLRNYEDD